MSNINLNDPVANKERENAFYDRDVNHIISEVVEECIKAKQVDLRIAVRALLLKDDAKTKWMLLLHILFKYIPEPKEDWEFNILSIAGNQPAHEIKERFIGTKLAKLN